MLLNISVVSYGMSFGESRRLVSNVAVSSCRTHLKHKVIRQRLMTIARRLKRA